MWLVAWVKISENGVMFRLCAMATACCKVFRICAQLCAGHCGKVGLKFQKQIEKIVKTFRKKKSIELYRIIMNHLVTGANTTKPLSCWEWISAIFVTKCTKTSVSEYRTPQLSAGFHAWSTAASWFPATFAEHKARSKKWKPRYSLFQLKMVSFMFMEGIQSQSAKCIELLQSVSQSNSKIQTERTSVGVPSLWKILKIVEISSVQQVEMA